MKNIKAILIITARTIRELIRARVLYSLLVFLLIAAWGSLFIGGLTFESKFEAATDLGLTGSAFFAAISAILIGVEYVGAVSSRVFWPALSAGVKRSELFAGRFIGAGVIVLILSSVPSILLYWSFYLLGGGGSILPLRDAALLLPLEALLIFSVSSVLSVNFSKALAFALSIGIWIACHMHPDPLAMEVLYPGSVSRIIMFIQNILPDLEYYNARISSTTSTGHFVLALYQTLVYSLLSVVLGIMTFRKRAL